MQVHEGVGATQRRCSVSLGVDPKPYPEGTHMCFIYNDDEERVRVLAKFVQSGLKNNEQVRYFSASMAPEEIRQRLLDLGVNLPEEAMNRQCRFAQARATYCPDGTFKPARMIAGLKEAYEECMAEGFKGLRVSGEMQWALEGLPGSESLIEYETRVNELLKTHPVTAICQYDARRFDGALLYRILSVHPMMIVNSVVVRNPYYRDRPISNLPG